MKKTSWGDVASWYDELLEKEGDSYQANVVLPNLMRVLEPAPGMAVLDIACGQGFFSRAVSESGAAVTGCDISPELIELAKKHAGGGESAKYHESVKYYVAPADRLDFINGNTNGKEGEFDAAIMVLAIQNIENMQGAMKEAARALKPNGRFIIVLNHPAFRIPGKSLWRFDEDKSTMSREIHGYMSDSATEIDMTPGEKDETKKRKTISFHRPLQSYFKSLAKSGFAVTRLEEWISHRKSQKGPRSKEEDRIRKEIPLFLMIEARKLISSYP